MSGITTEQQYLVNKMNRIAQKVKLGDLIKYAESQEPGLIQLAENHILVGGADGYSADVAMSGDVTILASGVTAIGSGKVLVAMLATDAVETLKIKNGNVTEVKLAPTTANGLHAARIAKALFDPSAVAGHRTAAAHGLGVTIPAKAIITRCWYDVLTTLADGVADAATIAIHAEGANDLVTATAIAAVGDVFDAGIHAAIPVGTAATMVKLTTAKELTVTVGGVALTAGKMVVFCEYVESL